MMKKLILKNWQAKEARPPPRKFQIGTIANLNEVRLRLRRASPYQRSLRDIGRARLCRANVRPRLAQKTREVFVFPTSGAFVEAELAFAAIEFVGVHPTPPITARLVRHDRM